MTETNSFLSLYGKPPLYQLIVSLLIILVVGLFLSLVFYFAGTLIFYGDLRSLFENNSAEIGQKEVPFLRYLLISQEINLFIIPSIIILSLLEPGHKLNLMNVKMPGMNEVILVVILAFCILPVTSITGQINSQMHLPDWLSGVEKWITEKEDNATRLIDSLFTTNTFGVLILNLVVIAVMPAIGEELVFRGVFQKIFCNLFKSGHLAIWITAFIFSAIHLQFFGFIPRFILGLVFGYLFLWSGTLWLPVISHFTNNAVPVIGAYIKSWEEINAPLDITLLRIFIGLLLPVIFSLVILLYFRNKSKKGTEIEMNNSPLTNS